MDIKRVFGFLALVCAAVRSMPRSGQKFFKFFHSCSIEIRNFSAQTVIKNTVFEELWDICEIFLKKIGKTICKSDNEYYIIGMETPTGTSLRSRNNKIRRIENG